MEHVIEFKDLKFPDTNQLISSFNFVKVYGDTRIYYNPNKSGNKMGFDFYVTEFHTAEGDYEKYEDIYKSPNFQALCLFWGKVCWDGLRHLYMGDEKTKTDNYLYYVNTLDLAQIFIKLRELEIKFCNNSQLDEKTK